MIDSSLLILALKVIALDYNFVSFCVLAFKVITPLNNLLLYGKNVSNSSADPSHRSLLNMAAQLTVPKSYFTHFYITLFVSCSLIQVVLSINPVPSLLASEASYKNLKIIHYLLWIQGARRWYECVFVSKFAPNSVINVSHYLVGMNHYVMVSAATFVGLALSNSGKSVGFTDITLIDWVLISAFLIFSYIQYSSHSHLASLKKYSLPAFTVVSSPHYTAEIALYSVLFVFGIKAHSVTLWVPIAYASSVVFVALNLGVSSLDTHKYYQQKYKDFKLKYSIIPYVI